MSDNLRGLRVHMRENWKAKLRPEMSDFWLERANLRPHRAYFRPERAEYKPGRVDLWPKRADFGSKRADFWA